MNLLFKACLRIWPMAYGSNLVHNVNSFTKKKTKHVDIYGLQTKYNGFCSQASIASNAGNGLMFRDFFLPFLFLGAGTSRRDVNMK